MATAAAIARLLHLSVLLELNIASYLMEVARENKRKTSDDPSMCYKLKVFT